MAFLPPFNASEGMASSSTPGAPIAPVPSPLPVNGHPTARQNSDVHAPLVQARPLAPASALAANGAANGTASPQLKVHPAPVPPSYVGQFPADPASSRPIPQPQPFSTTTQEILNRIGSTQTVDTDSPQWEAARKQVLQSMAGTSVNGNGVYGAGLQTPPKRGRGRGRPPLRKNIVPGALRTDSAASPSADGTPTSASTPTRGGRGRPRGRGRGSRRGAKRKRGDDDDDDSSSLSSAHTSDDDRAPHEPTVTKSGRSVNKPAAFQPAPKPESPATTPSRRNARRPTRRAQEMALCAKCLRGHSPDSNAVVFCDACNTPWHQWCHDPPIDRAAIDIPDKEWLCGACEAEREDQRLPMAQRVPAGALTPDERAAYLATLPHPTLQKLLLLASTTHPTLPVFAPNTRDLLRARSSARTSAHATPTTAANPDERYPDFAAAAATNDPPSTYPRPGGGPHAPRPTTGPDDVAWLLDDDNGFGAFSHYYAAPGGAALVPVQTGGDGREGSWIRGGAAAA